MRTNSPGLTTPDDTYHGVVYTEQFGKAAYITKCRTHLMRDLGTTPSPQNAFLLSQGIDTLHLRMERHCSNAPEGGGIPGGGQPHHLGNLSRPSRGQELCSGAEIYAPRHLRRRFLRRQGGTGRRLAAS